MYYTLGENNELVGAKDVHEWAKWHACNVHRCRVSYHCSKELEVSVSTVFVGLEMNQFETLVTFQGEELSRQSWNTWAEAEAGHALVLHEITASDGERRVDSLVGNFTEALSKVVSKVVSLLILP